MKRALLALSCCLVLGCNESTKSNPSDVTVRKPVVDADNTERNVRDRDRSAKTPFDQNENQSDIDTTAAIRKRVVDSKMSTDAHNVKIITQNGRVTLRGPVDSADEKAKIEELAMDVAGKGHVDNQLEVKERQ